MVSSKRQHREQEVLLKVIELFIEQGKPVGSETLRTWGFEHLSSATIRNYFHQLEQQGLLKQAHTSGGRFPTPEAFILYFHTIQDQLEPLDRKTTLQFQQCGNTESKHVSTFLQNITQLIAAETKLPTFLSSPRFDHDFILEIKLVHIDTTRILAVILTDFGQILTEIVHVKEACFSPFLERAQEFFTWKLSGHQGNPPPLSEEERERASALYNEILVRYIVRYSNFSDADLFRTGFSYLLDYEEFQDPLSLTKSLAIFENTEHLRLLLTESVRSGVLKAWIGAELSQYAPLSYECAVLTIPYKINHIHVGAIGILGPLRMPYKKINPLLMEAAHTITLHLTKNLYKFKLSFRQPKQAPLLSTDPKMVVHHTESWREKYESQ